MPASERSATARAAAARERNGLCLQLSRGDAKPQISYSASTRPEISLRDHLNDSKVWKMWIFLGTVSRAWHDR
jgi:hypothetical protein